MKKKKKKKILVLHTGGTIGMWWDPDKKAYVTRRGHLKALMDKMPELSHDDVPDYVLKEVDKLLDSSAMTPDDWDKIAREIQGSLADFDGFVVLHGTDTMGYTASALSFLLPQLDRPVVLTGAQIPLMQPRNDAREHLITSIKLAGTDKLPEVCLYFHGSLMRGNRASKVDADGYDAFASPNLPPLASVGVRIDVNRDIVLPPPPARPLSAALFTGQQPKRFSIGSFRIYPGVDPEPIAGMIPDTTKGFGLLLEFFGAGNGPEDRLREVLEPAIKSGVVVVATTQCLRGTVNLGLYAAGSWLPEIGVTSGMDMTPEAAMTKLHALLQRFPCRTQADEVRKRMSRNLRGELTGPYLPEKPEKPEQPEHELVS